ncbi:C40 family peptidase [Streptomyces sp. NPDC006487]|uniref:C40 family peptidase n=1 Tax=Streptomyces sp. NPDC006487 TaxID=3364748 RepID=UPI0036884942
MSHHDRTTSSDRPADSDRTSWRPHSPPGRPLSGRHRKPGGVAGVTAMRTGVVTGVLGTVAAVAPVAADAKEDDRDRHTVTMELDLRSLLHSSSAVTSDAISETADRFAREAAAKKAAAQKAAAQKAAQEKAAAQKAAQEKAAAQKAAREKAAKEEAARAKAAKAQAQAGKAKAKAGQPKSALPAPVKGAAAAVAFARAQVGGAYVYGGTSRAGYDCSGLVQAAYKAAGINLPRVSQDQSRLGRAVPLSALKPGDILYWGGKGSAYHVAIYIGGGKFVGAQNPSTGVAERSMAYDPPSGAVRLV